jgi:tetratricopeptide (TPR) repeat protein
MKNSHVRVEATLLLATLCLICCAAGVSAQEPRPRPPNPPVHRSVNSTPNRIAKRGSSSRSSVSLSDRVEDAIDKGNKARDKANEALLSEEMEPDQRDAEMKRQYAEAEKHYRHAALLNPKDARPYDGMGNVFSDQFRYDEAVLAYRKAVTLKPDWVEARLDLCKAYSSANRDVNAAVEECKIAIRLQPDHAEAHGILGDVYSSAHLYKEAIDEYKIQARGGPDERLAHAYENAGRYPEAIEEWKMLIKVSPSNPEFHSWLGGLYEKAGRYDEAEGEYKTAIGLKDDWGPHLFLGKLYRDTRRYSEAIEEYKTAIRLSGNASDINKLLGSAYEQMGRYADAIEAFKAAISASTSQGEPDSLRAESYYHLGIDYLMVNDKTTAMAEYEILKNMKSDYADKLLNEINKH